MQSKNQEAQIFLSWFLIKDKESVHTLYLYSLLVIEHRWTLMWWLPLFSHVLSKWHYQLSAMLSFWLPVLTVRLQFLSGHQNLVSHVNTALSSEDTRLQTLLSVTWKLSLFFLFLLLFRFLESATKRATNMLKWEITTAKFLTPVYEFCFGKCLP